MGSHLGGALRVGSEVFFVSEPVASMHGPETGIIPLRDEIACGLDLKSQIL